jgi:hypothetical protein
MCPRASRTVLDTSDTQAEAPLLWQANIVHIAGFVSTAQLQVAESAHGVVLKGTAAAPPATKGGPGGLRSRLATLIRNKCPEPAPLQCATADPPITTEQCLDSAPAGENRPAANGHDLLCEMAMAPSATQLSVSVPAVQTWESADGSVEGDWGLGAEIAGPRGDGEIGNGRPGQFTQRRSVLGILSSLHRQSSMSQGDNVHNTSAVTGDNTLVANSAKGDIGCWRAAAQMSCLSNAFQQPSIMAATPLTDSSPSRSLAEPTSSSYAPAGSISAASRDTGLLRPPFIPQPAVLQSCVVQDHVQPSCMSPPLSQALTSAELDTSDELAATPMDDGGCSIGLENDGVQGNEPQPLRSVLRDHVNAHLKVDRGSLRGRTVMNERDPTNGLMLSAHSGRGMSEGPAACKLPNLPSLHAKLLVCSAEHQ